MKSSNKEIDVRALIVPGIGTVVLRSNWSVIFTNRNRERAEISPEVVRAIIRLTGGQA